jgi:hypothetical protein
VQQFKDPFAAGPVRHSQALDRSTLVDQDIVFELFLFFLVVTENKLQLLSGVFISVLCP